MCLCCHEDEAGPSGRTRDTAEFRSSDSASSSDADEYYHATGLRSLEGQLPRLTRRRER